MEVIVLLDFIKKVCYYKFSLESKHHKLYKNFMSKPQEQQSNQNLLISVVNKLPKFNLTNSRNFILGSLLIPSTLSLTSCNSKTDVETRPVVVEQTTEQIEKKRQDDLNARECPKGKNQFIIRTLREFNPKPKNSDQEVVKKSIKNLPFNFDKVELTNYPKDNNVKIFSGSEELIEEKVGIRNYGFSEATLNNDKSNSETVSIRNYFERFFIRGEKISVHEENLNCPISKK